MKANLEAQRVYFNGGALRTADARRGHLRRLSDGIRQRKDKLMRALQEDLGKSAEEAFGTEIGFVLRDIRHAIRHLDSWVEPRKVRTPWMTAPSRSEIQADPLGVVLIIGPWNYPFQLLLSPMVGAIAAGNCVCLKPSELAPATAGAIASMMEAVFPPEFVSVCLGGGEVAAELSSQPFDHILFTGSGEIGRKVARAAADNLTPVTLELGGKSPCVVRGDADIELTARRIMWGKCLNAGQTCVAPDHVLVESSVQEALLAQLKAASYAMVPARPPKAVAEGYGRILNQRHFDRLSAYLDQGRVHSGGEMDRDSLTICPTVLVDIEPDAGVMQEEIFGPILPVLSFDDFGELLSGLRRQPKPLAAYLFSSDPGGIRRFKDEVLCGSICINDTISQIVSADLPLGGVGASGYGSYRGRASFETFSHAKSIMDRGTFVDPRFRYPPSKATLKQLEAVYPWLMR